MDHTDSSIQAKITVTTNLTEIDNEESIEEKHTSNVESLPPHQRVAITNSLLRCLPQRNSVTGRILTTIIIIASIVLLEVIIASDYSTLKVIAQSIVSTLSIKNETTSAATVDQRERLD